MFSDTREENSKSSLAKFVEEHGGWPLLSNTSSSKTYDIKAVMDNAGKLLGHLKLGFPVVLKVGKDMKQRYKHALYVSIGLYFCKTTFDPPCLDDSMFT